MKIFFLHNFYLNILRAMFCEMKNFFLVVVNFKFFIFFFLNNSL